MALKNQSYFTAKIGDVDLYSIKSMINYKIDNIEDRMKCVDIALAHGNRFYQEYFDKYCDPGITNSDMLLSDSNVVQSLESMANYILAKDDEYNKTESSYFVSEHELDRKMRREDEFDNTGTSLIVGKDETVSIYEEAKSNQNFKKSKTQTIKPSDLERNDELGSILRDYNTFINLISNYTKKDKATGETKKIDKKANLYTYSKQHSSIKDDMIICKDSMMKTHGYNLKYFSESTQPNYDMIDLTNIDHLLGGWVEYSDGKVRSNGLLSFKPTDDYQDDFNCIIVDVQNLIDNCDLNNFQMDVISLYQEGLKPSDIERELNATRKKVRVALDTVAKKVSKKAKELY